MNPVNPVKKDVRAGVALIVLLYLALGAAYALLVPPFEHVDEAEHFGVIRHIAEQGRLPTHHAPTNEVYHYNQEASQPPLYHALAAGLVRLLGLRAADAEIYRRPNPFAVCYTEARNRYDNRTTRYHPRDPFPWHGTLRMLYLLRALSLLLQAVTVAGTYHLARAVFPGRPRLALVGTAIVALNPQFILTASGVNNDNAITPLVTVGLYLLFVVWRQGLTLPRALLLGAVTGLAGLSKLGGWLLLPMAGIVTLVLLLREQEGRVRLALTALLIPALALGSGAWWFWRNWQLYADPLALRPMVALVGARDTAPMLFNEARLMFLSFWGQIPCSFYPPGYYLFFGLLMALGIGGLAWRWRKLRPTERGAAALLGAWIALVVASWLRWDLTTPAPWGRLLFPALPAIALLLALGVTALPVRRLPLARLLGVGQAFLALGVGARLLPAFYAPPRRYASPRAISPSHPVSATFGENIAFHGYDVALHDQPPVLEQPLVLEQPPVLEQPLVLDLTLYWRALAPMHQDYVLAVQLISPVVGDTTLRLNYSSWPGRGTYPTSRWQPGEIIADRYRLHLPEADFPTQAWRLTTLFYDYDTGERLPVTVGQVAGQPAGNALALTTLRVPGSQPDCSDVPPLEPEVLLGDVVALTHAAASQQGDELRVSLCWHSRHRHTAPEDYTVLVHLYDSQGALLSAGDGPPMRGAFPTSLWQPGDVVRDIHTLPLPPGLTLTDLRVGVGLYHPQDGVRLPAVQDGTPLPGDVLLLRPR